MHFEGISARLQRFSLAAVALLVGVIGCGGTESGTNAATSGSGGAGGGEASGGSGGGGSGGSGGAIDPGKVLTPGRNGTEFVLDKSLHPLGVPLVTRVFLPDNSGPLDSGKAFPVAFGYHGSGGLNLEPATPGDECTQELEPVYQQLTDFLLAQGVAAVWIDSFYSRDPRFCEDNTPEFRQFAPPVMDGDLQQVISRVYDTVIAENAFCGLPRFDCQRMLRIGTSEGGTAALLPSHRYLDHSLAQLFDPNSSLNKLDKLTLLTYSPLPQNRPQPKFIMPISPGCGFFGAIPFAVDGDTKDLFYPEQPAYLEMGSTDTVPAECVVTLGQGRRQLQAEEVKKREAISDMDYRYHTTIYDGAGHPLWTERTNELKMKLSSLLTTYVLP